MTHGLRDGAAARPEPILVTIGLSVRFGGLQALRPLDLRIGRNELVGLIGPNGAGKTTCIDALTGFVRSSGKINLEGTEISRWSAHRRARAGMVRTWQSTEIFDDLSVGDNLLVGNDKRTPVQMITDLVAPGRRRPAVDVDAVLSRFGLDHVADKLPSELSHGQRKLVGLACALAKNPDVILMDEPAAGLDTGESVELGRHLRGLVDDGTALLLIDHDMGLVLSVCDYIYVLDSGRLIAEGIPSEIRQNEGVLAAYLGRDDHADSAAGSSALQP